MPSTELPPHSPGLRKAAVPMPTPGMAIRKRIVSTTETGAGLNEGINSPRPQVISAVLPFLTPSPLTAEGQAQLRGALLENSSRSRSTAPHLSKSWLLRAKRSISQSLFAPLCAGRSRADVVAHRLTEYRRHGDQQDRFTSFPITATKLYFVVKLFGQW